VKNTWVHPFRQLVVMSSAITDEQALAAAYWLVIRIIEAHENKNYAFSVVDAQEDVYFNERKIPRVIMIHNVLDKASNNRIEHVRDLLLRYDFSVRILVLTNVVDPYMFCAQRIGIIPHYCVLFSEQTVDNWYRVNR
jgi:hypothetical protein